MTFAFVQSTSGNVASGTSVESDPLGVAPTEDSLLVAYFGSSVNASDNLEWPDGWLYIAGRDASGHGQPIAYQEMRWKIAGPAEPDTVEVGYPTDSAATIEVAEYAVSDGVPVLIGSQQTWDNLDPVLWSYDPPAGLPTLMIAAVSNYNGTDLIPDGFTTRETETDGTTAWRLADRVEDVAAGPYTDSIVNPGVGSDREYVRMRGVFGIEASAELGPAIEYDVYEIGAPGNSISYIATLDDAKDKAIRPVRNEPGSGQFTVNRHGPHATAAILAPGNLVKVRIPAIHSGHIFAFFMEKGDFTLVSRDEEGGEDITFGGRGALSYWDRAIWLSEKFVIPWWDVAWGTPPAGARGHVTFAAGKYRRYNIVGGVIDGQDVDGDGFDWFTTAGFEAYFDTRQTYLWPDENSKRFLVHLMAGETHAGWYVHPHQDGVTETLPSYAVGTSTSVLLSDISPDTPGAILYHLFLEGTDTARPSQPIPLLTVDFTATHDSNGDAWATTDALAGLTAELGETYLDTIVKLLSTGVIDIEMGPNLDMHAYNAQGRDLTGTTFGAGKVRFVKGVNIADELRRERDDNPVATFIEVVGTDNVIGRSVLPDAASRVAREISGTGDSGDETVLEAMGLAELNARLIKSDAIGFRIATGDDDATGLYLPGPEGSDNGDFWLGDITTLHTGTDEQDFVQEDERVFAITIAEDDGGNLEVTPEVGSVLGEAERRLYANTQARSVSFASRSQFTDTEVAEPPDLDQFELNTGGGEPVAVDHGNLGSSATIDAADGNHHRGVLNTDCTITVTPFPDGDITLDLSEDGAGGHTATFSGATVPVQPSTDPNAKMVLVLHSDVGTVTGFWAGGGGSAIEALEEGSSLTAALASIDFVGAGVTATTSGDDVTVAVPGGATASDAGAWVPVMDGLGNVVTDGYGQAVVAFVTF